MVIPHGPAQVSRHHWEALLQRYGQSVSDVLDAVLEEAEKNEKILELGFGVSGHVLVKMFQGRFGKKELDPQANRFSPIKNHRPPPIKKLGGSFILRGRRFGPRPS